MEMQKKNFEWGIISSGLDSTFYKLYGTQLDYDIIQAWLKRDVEEIKKLINKGANLNVNLEITKNGKTKHGTLLMHRVQDKPYIDPRIVVLKSDLNRFKVLASKEKGRHYDNLYKKTRDDYNNLLKKQENQIKVEAKNVIKELDLWLSLGGRLTLNGGRLDLSEQGLNSISFTSVKNYIIRANEIDKILEESIGDMYDNYEEFLAKSTELRNSDFSLEEIKNMLKSNKTIEHSINSYLDKRFLELQKKYPEIFSKELLDKAKQQYVQSTLPFDEQVKQIEKSIDGKILAHNDKNKKDNSEHFDRENKTFEQIKNAHAKIQEVLKNSGSNLFIAGGTVPYFILNEDSNRTHDDIDTIADLSDMSELRSLFKKTSYYKPDWDTLTYVEDGNDYGFEMIVDGVPVGIYPFKYDKNNGKIIQYTFDPYLKQCRIKNLQVQDLSDYITTYQTKNGENINAMSLEYIKLSKKGANRPKDIADNEKIDKIGVRDHVYSRITPYEQVQDLQVTDLNNLTLKYEATANAISRLDYETTNKYGVPLSKEDKENFMADNISNKYHEVRKNLAHLKNSIVQEHRTQTTLGESNKSDTISSL